MFSRIGTECQELHLRHRSCYVDKTSSRQEVVVCADREEPEDETLGMGRRGLLSYLVRRRDLVSRQLAGNSRRPHYGEASRTAVLRMSASPLALFDVWTLT